MARLTPYRNFRRILPDKFFLVVRFFGRASFFSSQVRREAEVDEVHEQASFDFRLLHITAPPSPPASSPAAAILPPPLPSRPWRRRIVRLAPESAPPRRRRPFPLPTRQASRAGRQSAPAARRA